MATPTSKPPTVETKRKDSSALGKSTRGVTRGNDVALRWVTRKYPQLESWRILSEEWMKGEPKGIGCRLGALRAFLERYLVQNDLPLDPQALLVQERSLPDFYRTACPNSKGGVEYNNHIHQFLEFVLLHRCSTPDASGNPMVSPAYHNPIVLLSLGGLRKCKTRGVTRENDATFGWVEREYPQLESWRLLAVEWMKSVTQNVGGKLRPLVVFLERYLLHQSQPLDPMVFLARGTIVRDFYQTVCPDSATGIRYNNDIHDFLNFVLLRKCSNPDNLGRPVVSTDYHNPVRQRSYAGLPRASESVHSPLPYGYIDELRKMLAAGPNFRDWHWAQSALGAEIGSMGQVATDWFPVTDSAIDRNDPDCVWRLRARNGTAGGPILESWSPARWVALLTKLLLPLRTFQVRMLDSGEADTWRYQCGNWVLNPFRLAQGSELRPVQQGVFRRANSLSDGESVLAVLYVNTNKSADFAKSGPDKGYTIPWPTEGEIHQSVFYWLEKLRDWQVKYNPIKRRTSWSELDGRHIGAKSDIQLASYPDACFLFRLPEARKEERHLPVGDPAMNSSWFALLEAFEKRLADHGATHRNGAQIRLLPAPADRARNAKTTLFPLHSLRVSLVTALALDGQLPFPVLQKLVGHSRLVMTLYYTKPGAKYVNDVLADATLRLEEKKDASIQNFLLDTEHSELLALAICNSVPSLMAAVPEHPAARNPVGWMPMHHGLCLVGGNTSELESNDKIGGCYNGGPNIGSASLPKFAPVPGGSRNCVRCRWFVTEPHHLPALAAHFNNLAYHVDEARNTSLNLERSLLDIKRQKADAEDATRPFNRLDEFRQIERLWETSIKRFSDLVEDLAACWRLIERCKVALEAPHTDGSTLVCAGTAMEVKHRFEQTESELLQLAGVCRDVEIYPDLDAGKAIFRRSQIFDALLYRDELPPVFLMLSEDEQLQVGNAFMDHLGRQMNPTDPALGQRDVIRLIDAGERLSQHLNLDFNSLPPVRGLPLVIHGKLGGQLKCTRL